MILIEISPYVLKVQGHANSQSQNKYDLVCAGVSAIIKGSLGWFDDNEVKVLIDNKTPSITIKSSKDKNTILKLNLLSKQLKTIQKEYPNYIKIIERNLD